MENFKYVLYLFTCASKGEKVEIIYDIDIKEIYNIAIKQGIWSIVFLAIKELYEKEKTVFNLNDELFNMLDCSFMQFVSGNIAKWNRLPHILKEIGNAGIDVCLLKGLTLGALYSEPYSRATADIDLLIHPKAEKKVCEILESQGFDVKYKWEGSHHSKCTRDDMGLIEVHTQLYDKVVQEIWYDVCETQNYSYIDFKFDKLTCKQLNPTDGFIFNFLHFIKHYIAGAITMKQLMDVMLYIKKYKADIDFEKISNTMDSFNYCDLFRALKCLAVKYLGFSPEELNEDSTVLDYSEKAEYILEDMYKYAATESASVYNFYTEKMRREKERSQKMTFSRVMKILQHFIWTDEKRMKVLYGEKYEKIYLKLFLQIHRIFVRTVKIKKYTTKKRVAEENEKAEAAERIELFKKLGVL